MLLLSEYRPLYSAVSEKTIDVGVKFKKNINMQFQSR
jgi:hypothetical protein